MIGEDIIVPNPIGLETKKQKILEQGPGKFHVLSDFDRTLTKAFVNAKKVTSIIYELRTGNYLSEDYSKKANELADKYHPIEINPNVPFDEKKKAMHEWWTKHFDLLINSGLKKQHIKQVVDSGKIQFRQGALEFLDYLYEKNIPLIIMSSTGLGGDSIRMMLERENKMYHNIHIVSNVFEWDETGKAVGVRKPIMHVMNKKEVTVKNLPIYDDLIKRKNVLLLGDGLEDIDMIEGFDYDNLIKVGFLNYEPDGFLEEYKKSYDVIILNDTNMSYVNKLLKEIVK